MQIQTGFPKGKKAMWMWGGNGSMPVIKGVKNGEGKNKEMENFFFLLLFCFSNEYNYLG